MMRALLLTGALLIMGAGAPPSPGRPAPACQEDQACWNCATMGNMTCGPSSNMSFDALN
jgi:hypothetical protein